MEQLETDYLVVGAGAAGMAFADALVALTDADVVLVDRRAAPGGHWLDAYPFVRLHQPSATYGVTSTVLGADGIDEAGPNAGFYERATAAEIVDYYARVLHDVLLPTGRVRFLGGTEHGGDHLTDLATGARTAVVVRRKVVDATYVESSIPSRHTPAYGVEEGVRLVPPNALVDLGPAPGGYTVLGAGKTAMDTCGWLLDQGVDPDDIEWYRPREPWLFNRLYTQPLDLVASYMHLQASWVEASARATDVDDFGRRLEADGVFLRIDPAATPTVFRAPTISSIELDALRTLQRVVRGERVHHLGVDRIVTDEGERPTGPGRVHVDCTAAGLRPAEPRTVFDGDRITIQYVTVGFLPWSAALIGAVEAVHDDPATKNRLCPPVVFTGRVADIPTLALAGMQGQLARAMDPVVDGWNDACRLNPARGAGTHFDDPAVAGAFRRIGDELGDALANLARLRGT